MSEINSISPRASFVQNENELSIVISAAADKTKAKNIGIILSLWIIGGILIGLNYFKVEDHNTKVFMLVWLAFWAYFSYVIAKAFLWQWSGQEILKIRNGKLFYKRDVKGRGWVLDYDLSGIKNIRKYGEKTPQWIKRLGGDYWNVDCDAIAFDSDEKEIAIGYKLSEQETDKIIKLLQLFSAKSKK